MTHALGVRAPRARTLVVLGCVAALVLAGPLEAWGQDAGAWFGLTAAQGIEDPPQLSAIGEPGFQPAAARVPPGEGDRAELEGERIRAHLEAIIGFSRESQSEGNQMWGRIAGFPSQQRTAEWVASQFQEAGLDSVEVQSYPGTGGMWWPDSWEARLLGDPAFGPGSGDVVLHSAVPTSGSEIPGGVLTAPLAFTGAISEEISVGVELAGRVAVQLVQPASGAYSERTPTRTRAQELMARGAVAVLNVVEQPGNMHVRDFSNCNGPCFNLGGADGEFLVSAMRAAAAAGRDERLRIRLSLDATVREGLTAHNTIGIVPGASDDNIIVNAHTDGWFDAAGDNADGLAVLVALARHFARPENAPERTLVFVASGGHHSAGLNGPSNVVSMNPELTSRTVLVVNLEHVAQLHVQTRPWRVDPTEQPMGFGISNASPVIAAAATEAMERYGFALRPQFSTSTAGDLGGYAPLGVPRVQAIHAGPLYHTSGDVLETISTPGLERAARFYAHFIEGMAAAPL